MATVSLPTEIQPRSPQGEFQNEPFTDFKDPENARKMKAALDLVGSQLGHEYDLIIGGHRLKTEGKIHSLNPARPAQVVGVTRRPGPSMPRRRCRQLSMRSRPGAGRPVEKRASLLLNAAEIIRERKFEFCAWLTYEVGKNWAEADADVGETIDFLEFYAREALRLAKAKTPIQMPGRAQSADVHSAGRGRGDSAVEFSVRDYGGDDGGFDRHRQHRDSEAFERFADDCGEVC